MRKIIILLFALLFAGSQSTWAQLKPAERYKTVYETESYENDGMIKIGLGWADKTILVPNGGQAPGIVMLTKAFNSVWPTYVVRGILKSAANPNFTEAKDDECGGSSVVDRRNGYLSESVGACDGDNMEATQILTPESSPVDTYQPKEGRDYWFSLPRHGKDFIITEMIHNDQVNLSSIYKFDGMKHVYSSQKSEPYE